MRYQQQSLDFFGAGQRVVRVDSNFVAPKITFASPVARSMTRFSPLVLEFYRNVRGAPDRARRRIYISRGKARLRRLLNEAELESALTQAGFEIVDTATMSFSEQVAMFQGAEFIIGPHGAGLANMLFCSPGAKVIEINHDNFEEGPTCYAALTDMFDLRYCLVIGKAVEHTHSISRNCDFTVSPSTLQRAIARISGKH